MFTALAMAFAVFVMGGFVAGFFFLSKATDLVGISSREKAAGADTGSVPGAEGQDETGLPTKQPSDPRYAFLLMGYGGAGHDGAYLTDSMMVVIVDPNQKSLSLLSIPRDSWVPLVFSDKTTVYNKVNTAFAFAKDSSLYTDRLPRYKGNQGAGTFAMDTVSRLLGIPISYYLALDFEGFKQAIDAVGGIDVDVPDAFSANYPVNDDPAIDPRWTVVRFAKGMQHMTGERAIQYARARETIDNPAEGSDFARAQRQRLIMEAFKTRLFQPNGLIHIPQLLAVGASHVDTNYGVPSAVQMAQLAMDWRNMRIYQTALTNENYLDSATGPEGTYILIPNTPDRSWAEIRALARRLWQDPELGTAMANTEIVVENDTGVSGVAGKITDVLGKMGYRVGTPTSGGTVLAHSQVIDRTDGDGKLLVGALQTDLHAQFEAPGSGTASGSGGITLRIGTDYASLADLTVPPDPSAPVSSAGVTQAASWSAAAPAAAPTSREALRSAAPKATTVPARSPTPGRTVPIARFAPTPTPVPASRTPLARSLLHTPTSVPLKPTLRPTPTATPTRPRPITGGSSAYSSSSGLKGYP